MRLFFCCYCYCWLSNYWQETERYPLRYYLISVQHYLLFPILSLSTWLTVIYFRHTSLRRGTLKVSTEVHLWVNSWTCELEKMTVRAWSACMEIWCDSLFSYPCRVEGWRAVKTGCDKLWPDGFLKAWGASLQGPVAEIQTIWLLCPTHFRHESTPHISAHLGLLVRTLTQTQISTHTHTVRTHTYNLTRNVITQIHINTDTDIITHSPHCTL